MLHVWRDKYGRARDVVTGKAVSIAGIDFAEVPRPERGVPRAEASSMPKAGPESPSEPGREVRQTTDPLMGTLPDLPPTDPPDPTPEPTPEPATVQGCAHCPDSPLKCTICGRTSYRGLSREQCDGIVDVYARLTHVRAVQLSGRPDLPMSPEWLRAELSKSLHRASTTVRTDIPWWITLPSTAVAVGVSPVIMAAMAAMADQGSGQPGPADPPEPNPRESESEARVIDLTEVGAA